MYFYALYNRCCEYSSSILNQKTTFTVSQSGRYPPPPSSFRPAFHPGGGRLVAAWAVKYKEEVGADGRGRGERQFVKLSYEFTDY